MRRGLRQQQQKRPSACLLCRYSSSLGYDGRIRPALRPTASVDGRTIAPATLPGTVLLNCLHSAKSYSVAPGKERHGGLSSTVSPRKSTSLGSPAGADKGRLFQRSYSIGGLPSWATQQAQPAASNDGLLPHERAARERAMARTRPPPTTPFANNDALLPHERAAREKAIARTQPPSDNPTASDDGLLPHERAAREKAMGRTGAGSKSRAPSWASAAPSWSTVPPPTAANSSPATPAQQADSLPSLLPHERLAKATVRAQDQSANPRPQQADPRAFLLPHERAARSAAASKSSPADRRVLQGNMAGRNDDYQNSQRQHGLSRNPLKASRGQAWQADPSSTRSRLSRNPLKQNQDEARQADSSSTNTPHSGQLLSGRLGTISSLTQPPTDEGEWKSLTRRERTLPEGLDLSPPRDTPRPYTGSTSQGSGSSSGVDQWKLMEKSVSEQNKLERKAAKAADENTWDWAADYVEEARNAKIQRIARETQEDSEPVRQEAGADTIRRRPGEREDRFGREERGDRREKEKPKRTRHRRREVEEDDNWDDDFYEERRRRKALKEERERQRLAELEAAGPTPIFLPEFISVSNLAIALGQKIDVFVSQLEELGFEDVSKDNILTGETAALVAQEYGFEPTVDTGEDEDLKPAPPPADPSSLPLRPPVVTIMGHVDHGKTTLLDYLRKSSIVSQEHGGITQHIGAFSVSLSSGKQITFLDTPGHAAFLSMRQRGANVTDMVILVVAADDSVMPQTLEALKHARAAKVPIIVAINKVDKPEANVDRVKADLATHGVEIEDYGGDVQVVCVSGKTGQGMSDLEENILLLSEMLDIRAERDGMAEGWVLESTIKPIGRVATVLVKRGTLRPGDFIVAGQVHAKIRSLRNEAGVEVDEAPPGTAVEVLGWKEPPDAGDQVLQAPDEAKAKAAVRYRQELKERGEVIAQMAQQEQERREREREREREKALAEAANPRRNRGDRYAPPPEEPAPEEDEASKDTTKYLTFLVKGDVHGSVEAVTAALMEQGNNEIRAKVLVSGPGQITESDVELAAVSGSSIINFNNTIPNNIKRLAHDAGVKILDHNVIYHLVEDVRARLADALPPLVVKKVVGEAEVLQVFPINIKGRKYKNIAGCRIGNGIVRKGSKARVIRGGETIFEGTIETLKHIKKDVTEMKKGSECGMSFADWDELQAGDHIQVIEEHSEKRKL
ncbi:hypothetical protein C8A03DRAFT_28853 [Achaetomium macrosporum]|uniref:Translation initiation factor IF-2, mitochondrial n=1 Tax=Achaetomium macrosporum TaxID=79813 RepID=A0AAN7HJY0_9PEZI|nr:hypothetical protein C8A03DRAFT_28853 [Achaetomium macrosporum]